MPSKIARRAPKKFIFQFSFENNFLQFFSSNVSHLHSCRCCLYIMCVSAIWLKYREPVLATLVPLFGPTGLVNDCQTTKKKTRGQQREGEDHVMKNEPPIVFVEPPYSGKYVNGRGSHGRGDSLGGSKNKIMMKASPIDLAVSVSLNHSQSMRELTPYKRTVKPP